MATKVLPNVDRLRNLYDYDAETGIITNKQSNTDTRASPAENASNKTKADAKHSKYLGVSWLKGKWVARIRKGGKAKDLGSFDSEEDAALAYDCAAIALHREFANPNFIKNPYLTRSQK